MKSDTEVFVESIINGVVKWSYERNSGKLTIQNNINMTDRNDLQNYIRAWVPWWKLKRLTGN